MASFLALFALHHRIKTLFRAVAGLLLPAIAFSQQDIKLDDINLHIGDSVKVCAKIYGGVFLERSKGSPTLLNVGGIFPANPLTLVIHPDVRKAFPNKPEEYYKDKNVCIIGRVEVFKEKPQIVINRENQLVLQ